MKVYTNSENDRTMYIGYGHEIMPIVRSMIKHERKCCKANRPCCFEGFYCKLPANMHEYCVYGIIIYPDGYWDVTWPSRTCAEVLGLDEGSDSNEGLASCYRTTRRKR